MQGGRQAAVQPPFAIELQQAVIAVIAVIIIKQCHRWWGEGHQLGDRLRDSDGESSAKNHGFTLG